MEPLSFGKYQLYERLAEGGMAVVWRAKLHGPGGFEKQLVVKQIRDELARRREFIDLFVAEAKLTVALTHANIVPIYELGMVDGTYFLALELIDGPPLATLIAAGALAPPLVGYVVEQVLRGLDYAHRRGVVHRDLSAANVLVSRDGEVKIVDFGIAAPVDTRAVQGGSHGYMPPEQEAGGRVDARSDLYTLGVVTWELLAGRRYDGGALHGPEALQQLVARATEKDPEKRWPDAAAMLAHLNRWLRDVEGASQAELSAWVRRVCPDVRVPSLSDDDAAQEVDRTDGPRTSAMAGRRSPDEAPQRQVTFATRIAPPPAPRVSWLRRIATVAGAITLLGLAALGGARVRDTVANAPLPPIAATARLSIHLEPETATLQLDGRVIQPGVMEVAPGTHRLKAAAPSYQPVERVLMLRVGGGADEQIVLKPEPGQLNARSEPPGAELYLGERLLGTTPLTVVVPIEQPLPLKLRRHDYAPVERVLDPAAFTGTPRAATLTVRLEPLARGELTLGALPWGHVTVDGVKRADTPLVRLPLSAGAHVVKVACPPTGRELKFSVTVEAGKEVKRVADLRAEPKLLDE